MEQAIDRFLKHLSVEAGASINTISAYSSDLQAFISIMNVEKPSEISRELILNYIERLNANECYKPATLKRRIASLRSFCNFLIREGFLDQAVFPKKLGALRVELIPKALSYEEVERLILAPDTSKPVGIRDRAILEVLYASGIRVSECASLCIADLNLERGFLRVRGKGGKVRIAPLGDYAVYWLSRYLKDVRPGYLRAKAYKSQANIRVSSPKLGIQSANLFLGRKGPLSRIQIYRIVQGYALKAGIKDKVTPHILRHSFATHLLENGADIRVVQELLGHASISTVEIYTRVTMKHLREVYEKAHPHA